jgi:hypothetical protein
MRIAIVLALLAACQSSSVSRSLGAECTVNSDCAQKCLPPDGNWPAGFCTTVCQTDADCASNAHCISEAGGVCAFACGGDPDCAFLGTGYKCQSVDGPSGKVMVCHGG